MQMNEQRGFALVTVLLLLALLMTMLVGYFALTQIEFSTTRSSMDSFRGFYAAEAGLNVRALIVRETFEGYNRPGGTSPDPDGMQPPCEGTNQGSADFGCLIYHFQDRDVATYVVEHSGNPTAIVIPRGEAFQNLNAQEYKYVTYAASNRTAGQAEAVLEMHFKSRLVPMFQFAIFYNKDLEMLPGPAMTLAGPVHANGDLYLGCHDAGGLSIMGQVTTSGDIYHGRKNADACMAGPIRVLDPEVLSPLPACSAGRRKYTDPDISAWNGQIQMNVDPLTVPEPDALDPVPGEIYWDKADLRIMLDLNGGTPEIQIRNADGTEDLLRSATLEACAGSPASHTDALHNFREDTDIEMLDINLQALLDCLHLNPLMDDGKALDDSTEGGLVWYLGVDGPDSGTVNNYGTRVRNADELISSVGGAPEIQGLTVVTNQAVYIQGHYNKLNKKPAAFLADSLNVLSTAWDDAASSDPNKNHRLAADTTIYAAFFAGTDTTAGIEGFGGQDLGNYNGGVENYPRFHEKWTNRTLLYRGSWVSLNVARHVNGSWGNQSYSPPIRNWGYDTDFNDAALLPPLSPRFVYLRQELFVRQFAL